MNDQQRKKRLARLRHHSTGPIDTVNVKAMYGLDYTVSRQGRMYTISRPTPDGQYVHRIMLSKYDVLKIADAIVDLYERHDAA